MRNFFLSFAEEAELYIVCVLKNFFYINLIYEAWIIYFHDSSL